MPFVVRKTARSEDVYSLALSVCSRLTACPVWVRIMVMVLATAVATSERDRSGMAMAYLVAVSMMVRT